VNCRDAQRLADIQAAIDAIRSHLERGTLADGLIFDAVRMRLLEIGEAVKALPSDLLSAQPGIPWQQIARMRDHLAHRYFDTALLGRCSLRTNLADLQEHPSVKPKQSPDQTASTAHSGMTNRRRYGWRRRDPAVDYPGRGGMASAFSATPIRNRSPIIAIGQPQPAGRSSGRGGDRG
jgi:uncharacterized protein with HEPN domain